LDYTHVALLASVRKLAALPTATAAGSTSTDILSHANEVLQSEVAPFALELQENYYVQTKSQTVTAGRASYRVPHRAMGLKLRDVGMMDAAGEFRSLAQESEDERGEYSATSGTPEAFYLQGNRVVLMPPPAGTSDTLQLPYFIRPNELVATAYGTISAINTTSGLVSFTATGTFQPSSTSVLDLVAATSGFECLALDLTPASAVAGVSVTFAAASLPADLAVGDYVCTQQTSPVPQLPAELHPLLYATTALRIAETLGNTNRIGYLGTKTEQLRERARNAYVPRVVGEPKIVSDGPGGLLGWEW
jgi:hypothetical protein